ncbi:hypothetical protein [Cellulomonas palmilytica]|uniref:hypothetical protein n=1 Tax=Cellulomonas palmilytica TaxID=2608402 RepID=UPI001F1CE7C0|nr:hypothetical protein [Cellulomonas palmilytica]UJP40996.1 hypothetical protein F1D97_05905 [Cellulomonas palmilytica]
MFLSRAKGQRVLTARVDGLGADEVSHLVSEVVDVWTPAWIQIDAIAGAEGAPQWALDRLLARAPKNTGGAGVVLTPTEPDRDALIAFAPYSIYVQLGERSARPYLQIDDADDIALYVEARDPALLDVRLDVPPWEWARQRRIGSRFTRDVP